MPRIFKFSKFALKLFVPHASELTDMKIYIYTDNFDIAYVVTSGFSINVNEVVLVIPKNAVNNVADGVINYRVEGYLNGDFYMEQRQSNYYLKTPSFEIEEVNIINVSTDFVDEGNYKMVISASDYDADGLRQVEIDATTFAEEKYEEGKAEGSGINEEELNKYLEEYITEEELETILESYSPTDIIELTKEEYETLKTNGEIDENKLYLINDSTIALKTINGQSLIGEGNIEVVVDLSGYATEEYVNTKLGDIETLLDNIIGQN